jgi:hypothetical protein
MTEEKQTKAKQEKLSFFFPIRYPGLLEGRALLGLILAHRITDYMLLIHILAK